MRNRVSIILITLSVLVAFSQAATSTAYGCTPVARLDPQTARNNADVIFIGSVVAVDDSPFSKLSTFAFGTESKRVLFDVTSVWKGPATSEAIVSVDYRICDITVLDFHEGEDFLVYADNGTLGSLEAPLFGRTSRFNEAAEDLEVLGKGNPATEQADLRPLFYFQTYWAESAFGLILMVIFFRFLKARNAH
jgi:hypothetical protein